MTIRRRLIAESFWIRFGGVWLLVGAIFLFTTAAIVMSRHDQAYREIAEGVVLAKANNPSRVFPTVDVEYAARDGVVRHVSSDIAPALWESLDVGSAIGVRYDRRRPDKADVEGTFNYIVLYAILGGLGAYLTLMGAWILRFELARIRRTAGRRG